jgi:TP901-1 family phage major tail protein
MAKIAGRKFTLWDTSGTAALVAGGREHGISINGELMDVTDKGSSGWRELLDDIGVRSVDVSVSGLVDTGAMIAKAMGPTTALISAYELRVEGLGIFAGDWAIEGLELTSPHDGPAEQNFTVKSSGEITWTPA